eukprot:Clim_evm13s155 gene=Clim_evmTU13s155
MSDTKPQIFVYTQESLNYTVYDAKWIPSSARIASLGSHANGKGALQIYELDGASLKKTIEAPQHAQAFKCGTFKASRLRDRSLATGDFGGGLHVWDLERPDVPIYAVDKAHDQIINAIDGCGGIVGAGAPEIATSARDGVVKVWDTRQRDKPVATMQGTNPSDDSKDGVLTVRDAWCVAFGDAHDVHHRVVAAGYDNGDIKLFDLAKMSLLWETNVGNGVCGLEFDRSDIEMNKLVATTLEGKIIVFDMRTRHPEDGFARVEEKGIQGTVWSARHLPSNRDVFMTTGGNGSIFLYRYNYPDKRKSKDKKGVDKGVAGTLELLNNAKISDQPVSTWDWHHQKPGLAVCSSFDQSFRVVLVTRTNLL